MAKLSPALAITLRSSGLVVATDDVSKPKQTDTTRRWKVPILAKGQSVPVRTKIEFSNRNGEQRYALEAVPARVVAPYGAFADQVLPFLDPEVADLYDETTWLQMQSFVVDMLLEEDR